MKKGDLHQAPLFSDIRWRSEVERHTARGRLEGGAADRVVGRVARAYLVTVPARTKTVVRVGPLREHRADDVPAGPLVEVVAAPTEY